MTLGPGTCLSAGNCLVQATAGVRATAKRVRHCTICISMFGGNQSVAATSCRLICMHLACHFEHSSTEPRATTATSVGSTSMGRDAAGDSTDSEDRKQ